MQFTTIKVKFIEIFCLLPLVLSGAALGAGNAQLMAKQQERAFLLNKNILSTLEHLEGQSDISFSGTVIRGSDGKLRIKIDRVNGVTPYNPPRPMDQRTKIEYVTFEEMLENQSAPRQHEAVKPKNTQPGHKPLLQGGGSALP